VKYLDRHHHEELRILGKTQYKDYEIRWIPLRFFSIKKSNRVYKYFDLFQFYHMSLDHAGKKYVGMRKIEIDKDCLTDRKYIEQHRQEIIEYCIQDCRITKALGEYMQRLFNKLDVSFDKPFSLAYISQEYFMKHCDIPQFRKSKYQEYAFKSYYGGRFEVFKRGYFDKVYEYDINSAYPCTISNLLDLRYGSWFKVKDFDDDADLGFYRVRYSCDDEYICALAFKKDQINVYPRVRNRETYITHVEAKYILDHSIADLEILDGWVWKAYEYVYPFEIIKDLYYKRQELKQKGDELQLALKLIMNSLYGKFIQLTPQVRKLEAPGTLKRVVEITSGDHAGEYELYYCTGVLFNAVYASTITATTRVQLLDMFLKHRKRIIAGFTDSVFLDTYVDLNSDKLGEWKYEGSGDLLMIGSGVYTFRKNDEIKSAIRGIAVSKNFSWFDVFKQYRNEKVIPIKNVVRVSLKQVLAQPYAYSYEDMNLIIDKTKEININMDRKRQWEREFKNAGEMLETWIDSTTLEI